MNIIVVILIVIIIFGIYLYVDQKRHNKIGKQNFIKALYFYDKYKKNNKLPNDVLIITYIRGFSEIDEAYNKAINIYNEYSSDEEFVAVIKKSPVFYSKLLREIDKYKKNNNLSIVQYSEQLDKDVYKQLVKKVRKDYGYVQEFNKVVKKVPIKITDDKEFYLWIENNYLYLLDIHIIGIGKFKLSIENIQEVYNDGENTILNYIENNRENKIIFNKEGYKILAKMLPAKIRNTGENKKIYENEILKDLSKLGQLKKDGIITESEFNEKKKILLNKISL